MPVVTYDNMTLHYTVQGNGKPLVLLHGLGSSSCDWEYQIPAFSNYFTVYCFDLPGHGDSSDVRRDVSLEQIGETLFRSIETIGLESPDIVGFSLGGMVALEIITRFHNSIGKTVLVNTMPELPLHSPGSKIQYIARKICIRLLPMSFSARVLAKKLFPDSHQAEYRLKASRSLKKFKKDNYLNILSAMKRWSVRNHLQLIQSQVIVIGSDMDYTSIEYKIEYTRRIKDAHFHMISNSRHMTPVDQSEEFNQQVIEFLTS